MTMVKNFSRLLFTGCLAVFVITTVYAQKQTSTKPREALLNPKTIEPINAEEFRAVLAHHRGLVVVVNLWATWCIPCLKELPDLAKMHEKYVGQGLRVITVSMDDQADLTLAKKMLADRAPGLNGYLQTENEQQKFVSVIDPTWSEIMPTTFVIDRDGKLNTKLTGGKTREEFESAITPLLNSHR
jgi:thiol-disulfide isomerase/thioredoxin